jgi:hypothetical protein
VIRKNISAKHTNHVTFCQEEIDRILEQNPLNQGNIISLCEAPGTTFKYGLGLLQQKKGINHVVIPRSGIDNPE